VIEEPCGKPQGIFDRKDLQSDFDIRSRTLPQAAGNTRAVAVQLPGQTPGFLPAFAFFAPRLPISALRFYLPIFSPLFRFGRLKLKIRLCSKFT
jgi:hypothetical protein